MKSILKIFLVAFNFCSAQSDVPLTLRAQFNGKFGYTILGNTLNPIDNRLTPSNICTLLTQASATLNLLPTQNVTAAFLYWNGIGDGTFDPIIQLNNIPYAATNTFVGYPESSLFGNYFSSFVDVTAQIQAQGNGVYTFSNLNLNPLLFSYCSNSNYTAGWHLIVIFNDITLPNNQLNIYDGINILSFFFNNGNTPLTITNLNVTNSQNSKLTYVASNGSPAFFLNESVSVNSNILSNASNPPNNPFNGTNSFTGTTTNWNQDIDTFDISSFINIGDAQANILFKSFYYRYISSLITSIRSELPDATVALTQVTGQNTCGNRNLSVNYTVNNTNSNGNLPANVPVSFYANNTLLQTVNTPSSVAIGGTLPLQTTVVIPANIPNTFNLRVVVDNTASNTSTIAESNENNNEASQSITLLGNTITSIFSLATTFCAGDVVPVLPTSSNNGIVGVWSPSAINNQTSGAYTFSPIAAVCASPFTLNVVINSVLPTFSVQNTFCQGANVPVLPTTSSNGISGSWSPNVIDNQISGAYIFTPNVGQPTAAGRCALPFSLNVAITPKVTPVFSIPIAFCQGANVPVLPTTSNNGVLGSWSPNVISNQQSSAYVFTPNVGVCASSFTLNVIVTPNVLPTFSLPILLCQNAVVPVLPVTSNNGVIGSWSPNVINNQVSGAYVFSPNAGQCALLFTLNVTIQSQTVTTANLLICNDAQGNNIRPVDLDSGLNPNDFSFAWSKDGQVLSQTTTSISATAAGNYELSANPNGLNCPQIYRFNVTALTPISASYLVSDDFEPNQTIKIEASGGSGQYQYSFDNLPFQSYPIYSVLEGGDIVVKVRDNNTCYELSTTLTLWQYPRFFTPNGDGFNDTWTLNSSKKIKVSVFDRFGRLVKQFQNGESWNGTFNSQPLPADDYWFAVDYLDKTFKGHFSLKR